MPWLRAESPAMTAAVLLALRFRSALVLPLVP
jgi:hypothetical protein